MCYPAMTRNSTACRSLKGNSTAWWETASENLDEDSQGRFECT